MEQELTNITTTILTIDSKITAALIAAGISALLGAFSIYQYFDQKRVKRKEDRKKFIEQQLNEFYGPLSYYINTSKALYTVFKSNKPKELRLLTHLLDPKRVYLDGKKVILNDSDDKLILKIIGLSEEIEKLIYLKGSLVDDVELTHKYERNDFKKFTDTEIREIGLFARMLAHFNIVKMAYNKEITNNHFTAEDLKDFVYPEDINDKITINITNLQKELKKFK
ncbi:hypothetical protein PJV97_01630 [Aliarcobacter butzleri]|uniref:hypothetical protein n=1 Tax=Aliarcobacter butzleri TaxID=28197 RepID=UPI00263D59B1|nr:hypothetical protein [Aliarcobacter butzleri]MDN5111035.1 hypothetical protein [Aliarcobacter butzleri]